MRIASPLGAEIEDAVARNPAFHRHRDNVQYLCCYQTSGGTIFAFERVTSRHINLWIPEESEKARRIAESFGSQVERKVPWPDPLKPHLYGRISSLKSIPELRDRILYKVPIATSADALAVLAALR